MKLKSIISILGIGLVMMGATSCSKTKSYSELLRDEERAVNWYLAQNEVEVRLPEDSVFKTGEDAPFYKMDGQGNVYMRVINPGDKDYRAKTGDRVYFKYMRQNISDLKAGLITKDDWIGNSENMATSSTYFVLDDITLPSSATYGTGIQIPMKWLGYYSEVELIIKSVEGWQDQADVIPVVYRVRYFPAEY